MSVLGLDLGYTAKYGLSPREFPRAQDMQTFKNQAKIMLPFLVTLLLIKVSNCA